LSSGLARFLARKSLAAILSLVVVVAITAVVLQFSLCAQFDAKLIQIIQQIEDEIIAKKLVFDTAQERKAYIDTRAQQEIQRLGLSICV
jgi:predicted amino acid-binding ACT domain protein